MSCFVPTKEHFRQALLFCFNLKKKAAESHRMLVEAYGEEVPSETTCREWFRRFKIGDYEIKDKYRSGQPKKFKDEDLKALLDKNPRQTLAEMAATFNVTIGAISKRLKTMEKVQSVERWVPADEAEND